jgi:hypothetical protein
MHAVNVMHLQDMSGTKDAAEVFLDLDTQFSTHLWEPLCSGAVVTEVEITPLDGTSATVSFATDQSDTWHSGTDGQCIPQMAAITKFSTPQRGRQGRGRLYLPFVSENVQSGGALSSLGPWQAAWTALLADLITAQELALVVASYTHTSFSLVNRVTCEHQTGTQRRRQQRNR